MSSAAPTMSTYVGEYIWFDDNHQFRSKTRTFVTQFMASETGNISWPEWNYDGSSTAQAEGNYSEVILNQLELLETPLEQMKILILKVIIHIVFWFFATLITLMEDPLNATSVILQKIFLIKDLNTNPGLE